MNFHRVVDAVDSNQAARDVASNDSSQLVRNINCTDEHSSLNLKGIIT